MNEIIDLDILKPAKKILKLNGKEIDVSFIPTAITFDIDTMLSELRNISKKEIEKGEEECKKAFDLSIRICVSFAENSYTEMDYDWFSKNTTAPQINAFIKAIEEALVASYKGVSDYGKK
jgi:hypothetical protein